MKRWYSVKYPHLRRRGVALVTFGLGVALVYLWLAYLSPFFDYLRGPAVDVEAVMRQPPPDPARMADRDRRYTDEEYAVYSAVLEQVGQKRAREERGMPPPRFFVVDETATDAVRDDEADAVEKSIGEARLPERELVEAYKARNRLPLKLGRPLDTSTDYVYMSVAEFRRMFDRGVAAGWEEFYQKYRGAAGTITFSGVGLNERRDRALVYAAHGCGGTCGSGAYYVLSKKDGVWAVDEVIGVWIS